MAVVPFVSAFLSMPVVGYGTWQTKGDLIFEGTHKALKSGYRHIDTATVYENEKVIGEVLKEWLEEGRVKREDLFITTKLPPGGVRPSSVSKFLDKSLRDLKLDYIDLYLIHTPFAFAESDDLHPYNEDGTIMLDTETDHVAVWKELENQHKLGKVKAIGLSNFNKTQIQRILDNATIKPANLQVEMHLYHQQKELVQFCKDNNISVTAYSPLGSRGSKQLFDSIGKVLPDMLGIPQVEAIAEKHNKTSAQILLKHLVTKGVAVIPKSTQPQHIRENIDIFDFELTPEDLQQLDALDQGEKGRLLDFQIFKGITNHPEYPF